MQKILRSVVGVDHDLPVGSVEYRWALNTLRRSRHIRQQRERGNQRRAERSERRRRRLINEVERMGVRDVVVELEEYGMGPDEGGGAGAGVVSDSIYGNQDRLVELLVMCRLHEAVVETGAWAWGGKNKKKGKHSERRGVLVDEASPIKVKVERMRVRVKARKENEKGMSAGEKLRLIKRDTQQGGESSSSSSEKEEEEEGHKERQDRLERARKGEKMLEEEELQAKEEAHDQQLDQALERESLEGAEAEAEASTKYQGKAATTTTTTTTTTPLASSRASRLLRLLLVNIRALARRALGGRLLRNENDLDTLVQLARLMDDGGGGGGGGGGEDYKGGWPKDGWDDAGGLGPGYELRRRGRVILLERALAVASSSSDDDDALGIGSQARPTATDWRLHLSRALAHLRVWRVESGRGRGWRGNLVRARESLDWRAKEFAQELAQEKEQAKEQAKEVIVILPLPAELLLRADVNLHLGSLPEYVSLLRKLVKEHPVGFQDLGRVKVLLASAVAEKSMLEIEGGGGVATGGVGNVWKECVELLSGGMIRGVGGAVGSVEIAVFIGWMYERWEEEVEGEEREKLRGMKEESYRAAWREFTGTPPQQSDGGSNSDSDNDNDNNASYKDWITNDSTWRNLGDTCTISGFTLFASRMYGRAALLEPGRWSNWVGLGKSLRKLGRDRPALAAIKRARELSEGTIAVRQVEALVKLWGEEGMEKIFQEEMESPIEVVVEEYVFGGRILRGVRDGRG